ncbi:MAG: hypothetical protein ACTSXD_05020 [Candidatus Heimdallarchaeaceae archaeon]
MKKLFERKTIKKYGEIDSYKLKSILKDNKKRKENVIYLNKTQMYFFDNSYNLTNVNEIENFLKSDKLDWVNYKKEINDCDDFAIRLWGRFKEIGEGFCFGLGVSGSHAFNIFVDDDFRVWIIEPQTDKIYKLEDIKGNKKYYPLKLIIV